MLPGRMQQENGGYDKEAVKRDKIMNEMFGSAKNLCYNLSDKF